MSFFRVAFGVLAGFLFLGLVVGFERPPTIPLDATWEPVVARTNATATRPPHRPPRDTAFEVTAGAGAGIVGLLAIAIALSVRHARRARAEDALAPGAPLVDGPAVVFGVVEGEPSGAPPVVVTMFQLGTQQEGKGGPSHSWKETLRDIEARPFILARPDGSRVQVDPEERVVVHEALTTIQDQAFNTRSRVATIAPGMQIHVTGVLSGAGARDAQGAYRSSGALPTLRPPRRGPMVIAHEPSGATERARARFHGLAAAGLVAVATLVGVMLGPVLPLALFGNVVDATPTETAAWREWVPGQKGSRGYWVDRYALRAVASAVPGADAPVELEALCDPYVYRDARHPSVAHVPFVVAVTGGRTTQIVGDEGPVPGHDAVATLMLFVAALGLYAALTLHTRPWYLRRGSATEFCSGPLPGG